MSALRTTFLAVSKMMISPGFFFIVFFQILIFWVVRMTGRGVNRGYGAKIVSNQNEKKFCLSCFISQEPYFISGNIDAVISQFIFFTIKFHKHEKEYKAIKSTTNLRFINLKFIDTRFFDLKFIDIRFIDLKFMDIRFIKPKKHLSGKK